MTHDADFVPALIVFGIDEAGKPHASVFDFKEIDAARTAAELMGMRDFALELGEHREIIDLLPPGRVFGSGKAFVPFVKADLYDRIAALAGPPDEGDEGSGQADGPDAPETAPTGSPEAATAIETAAQPTAPAATDPWAELKVGSIVLASAATDDGFWEARVTKVKAKGIFTLKFCDYPTEPAIDRQIRQLGLLHPNPMKPA
jgi:hypothetical protein